MPREQPPRERRRFYRRITDKQWQDETHGTLQDTAFHIRDGETGLSVFDADKASPREVLEHQLVLWREIAQDAGRSEKDRKWAARKLEQCGDSVVGLLGGGWGVAVVTEALFLRCGFQPSSTVDPNGHLGILGSKEAFEEQSLMIIDDPECWILSKEECLA